MSSFSYQVYLFYCIIGQTIRRSARFDLSIKEKRPKNFSNRFEKFFLIKRLINYAFVSEGIMIDTNNRVYALTSMGVCLIIKIENTKEVHDF